MRILKKNEVHQTKQNGRGRKINLRCTTGVITTSKNYYQFKDTTKQLTAKEKNWGGHGALQLGRILGGSFNKKKRKNVPEDGHQGDGSISVLVNPLRSIQRKAGKSHLSSRRFGALKTGGPDQKKGGQDPSDLIVSKALVW